MLKKIIASIFDRLLKTCKALVLQKSELFEINFAEGVNFLQKFAYLGPVTSLHLAKNIGLPCVKPDRHLTKIAHKLGFENPKVLCESIAKEIEESPSVVDIVLWRYATLTKNYIDQFTF